MKIIKENTGFSYCYRLSISPKSLIRFTLKKSTKIAYIIFIEVENKLRGNGYGEQLMKEALETIQNEGIETINVIVAYSSDNSEVNQEQLLSFYKKIGFVEKKGYESSVIKHMELKLKSS